MTRSELAFLSQAQSVAYAAMCAPETQRVPLAGALALQESVGTALPDFAPSCTRFLQELRANRRHLPEVAKAGRSLRDAVVLAMAFRPVDAHRVDIHG